MLQIRCCQRNGTRNISTVRETYVTASSLSLLIELRLLLPDYHFASNPFPSNLGLQQHHSQEPLSGFDFELVGSPS